MIQRVQDKFDTGATSGSVLSKLPKRVWRWRVLGGLALLWSCHAATALEINQANEAELDSIKGMGPSLTAKVLEVRAHGPFNNWQDLMQRVKGIRQAKAQQFSDQGLTVQGEPFAR